MRFIFYVPKFRSGDDPEKLYEHCAFAEELGFDICAIGHHSFLAESGDPAAPLLQLAAIAARTKRLKLLTTVFLLSLHHPAAIAEQLATLDQLSQGRAIFGVGVGYRDFEFRGFGVDPKTRGARVNEALQAMRAALAAGRWSHRGRFWTIEDLEVYPETLQKPHPPMWIGGKSEAAFRRAARLGDGWISDTISDLQGEKAHVDTYRRYCQEAGRAPGEVVVLRNAWVSETRKEAGEVIIPAMRDWFAYYDRMGAPRPNDPVTNRVAAGEPVPVEEYAAGRAFAGTPDDVIREIKTFRDTLGVDCFGIVATGPQDTASLRRMLTLFGKEVIPAFR